MDVERYAEGWRERARADEASRAERAEELLRRARAAAAALGRLGARRVVLFGSLSRRRPHRRSDIDLAVEGLPSSEFFHAFAVAEDAAGKGVAIDLVRLEEARPRLRRTIEQGEVLFAR